MKYAIEFKPKAIKDLNQFSFQEKKHIIEKIELLENNLQGNVKRLTNYTYEYRLRIGNYRVLFEIENKRVIIYCIKHRKEAYRN